MSRLGSVVLGSLVVLFSSSASSQDQPDYFPLQEGNTWTYVHEAAFDYPGDGIFGAHGWPEKDVPLTDYLRAEYVTVTTIGIPFDIVSTLDEPYYYLWDTFSGGKLFRKSEAGDVLQYANGEERRVYDLSLEGGEEEYYSFTKTDRWGDELTMQVHRQPWTREVPAGAFEGFMYGMSIPYDLNYWWLVHLAPDVGVVYWPLATDAGEWDELSLLHATMNGRYYGASTARSCSSWGAIKNAL